MKRYLPPKHLPIPLGLIVSLLGLVGGIFLINQMQSLGYQASAAAKPQEVKITNISHSSFVVTWTTTEAVEGIVSLGETPELGEIRKDIRDQEKNQSVRSQVHYVLVDNLKPEKKYYFKIISQGSSFGNPEKPFEVTTAPEKIPADNDIAFGKILTPDQQSAADCLVFLSLANTITQAAITDTNGHWLIPLSTARSLNLKEFTQYDREAQIEEIFVKGQGKVANATLTTGNDSPVPDIVLGQSYDFSKQLVPPITQEGKKETSLQVPTSLPPASEPKLEITFPSENESVNSSLPEFFGFGPEGEKLTIEVESEEKISSQTNVGYQGSWKWTPNIPLSPGEHKITVSYTDTNGIIQKVSRSFIVLAAGESDLPSFTATPSGETTAFTSSLTPTTTSTPTPTTITLAKAPSASVTPTTADKTATDAGESETPTSGNSWPTKLFWGAGLSTLLLGAALIIF